MTPQPEQIKQAIDTAAGDEALDQLAKLVWSGLAENALDQADAEHLVHQIAARRRVETTGLIRPIRAFERGPKTVGNVLANLNITQAEKAFDDHGLSGYSKGASADRPSLVVSVNDQNEGRAGGLSSSPERGGAKPITAPPASRKLSDHADRDRRRCRKKQPGKRGPKPSKPFAWSEVKQIADEAHDLRRAGFPLNAMATTAPDPDRPPAETKKSIQGLVAHIGESLGRIGAGPHIGLTVFETTSGLHAHHLFHVPKGAFAEISRRHHRDDGSVHIGPAPPIGYVLKERKNQHPDFEAEIRKQGFGYRRGGEVPGKRHSWTGPAKAILAASGRNAEPVKEMATADPIEQKIAAAAAPPPMIEMQATPAQLRLFADDELPEVRADADLPDAIRAVRIDAGITQTALAKRIGIRQPHLANVERHHDHLGRATRRAARYIIERIAA